MRSRLEPIAVPLAGLLVGLLVGLFGATLLGPSTVAGIGAAGGPVDDQGFVASSSSPRPTADLDPVGRAPDTRLVAGTRAATPSGLERAPPASACFGAPSSSSPLSPGSSAAEQALAPSLAPGGPAGGDVLAHWRARGLPARAGPAIA